MFNQATSNLVDVSIQAGNTIRFSVPSTSMSPFLIPGDQVIVSEVKVSELKIGDILVWKTGGATDRSNSSWIVHRLIEQRNIGGNLLLITKGDNAIFADQAWSVKQLCGRVVLVQRRNAVDVVDMVSRRSRWFGSIIALLSRAQAAVTGFPWRGFTGRIFVKALRIASYSIGILARKIIG